MFNANELDNSLISYVCKKIISLKSLMIYKFKNKNKIIFLESLKIYCLK